jgi:cell division protein FtsB
LLPAVRNGAGRTRLLGVAQQAGVGEVEWGGQAMDFRVKKLTNIRRFPTPQDGLRAVVERAPRAEALAASWMTKLRPIFARIHALRRRIATIAVAALAGLLFVHVMLGANGMVVYKQKRTEYEALHKRIALEQKENQLYTERIQGMKTDTKAIEKEAREQLHYARPGEYVYVPPDPVRPDPPANHSAHR